MGVFSGLQLLPHYFQIADLVHIGADLHKIAGDGVGPGLEHLREIAFKIVYGKAPENKFKDKTHRQEAKKLQRFFPVSDKLVEAMPGAGKPAGPEQGDSCR